MSFHVMMPENLKADILAGQCLVFGLPGPSLPASAERALVQGHSAGVIFFRRNAQSLEAATALAEEIQSSAPPALPPVFVCLDEEGGRVQRLPEPFVGLPPMLRLAGHASLSELESAGHATGIQLAAAGFNLNFAPVLDCHTNDRNPVIGDRAFGQTPEEVTARANAFARGLLSAGILPCGKHFPGHGDTDVDSHLSLPHVSHSRARLDTVELRPFRELAQELPALMSAHVVTEALDPQQPGTLSRRISTDLLRNELSFSGVLFSDDMEMRALDRFGSDTDVAVAAVSAGCDVLLICSDWDRYERTHFRLSQHIERDPAFRLRCEEAVSRSCALRASIDPRRSVGHAELMAARETCTRLGNSAHR